MSARRYLCLLALLLAQVSARAGIAVEAPPLAMLDLTTGGGVEAVAGAWRYSDVQLIPTSFRAADAAGQPSGEAVASFDYAPHAGGRDYDDSVWPVIDAATLGQRRGSGRVSFNWYRLRVTVPETLGGVGTRGKTLVFATTLDDYAEIWVDGELPRAAGQVGASVIAGWNATNRVVIGTDVHPGQSIQLAVFGINGPISASPTNFIYVREARLELYPATPTPFAITPTEVNVEIELVASDLDAIVPANPKLFKIAQGFTFTEGPVWTGDGRLLFSDPNANRIYAWSEQGGLSVFREHSGYAGADIGEYTQPGANGLTIDARGRLTVNEHGNRRVTRSEADGTTTVLAERYGDKRLNSPNDLVYKNDGALYFTDPPFGLPKFADDPRRELDVSGTYRVKDGTVELLADDLKGPNGLAFSPDERWLYVGNWDLTRKVVMRYAVRPNGRLGPGEVFFDMTAAAGEDAIDGIKVDTAGNLYVSGPGGIWILDADGHHLGTIHAPRQVHNMAWGDADARTLYMTAHDRVYRMPLLIPGVRPTARLVP